VHAARGLGRVWAWIWACIWAQRGVGAFGGWGLRGLGGGQGGDVVVEFLSAAPHPNPKEQKKACQGEKMGQELRTTDVRS
jgi:hypothetical protein